MDLGVGSFVFGRGLVNRGKIPSLRSNVPLLVIGFIRLALTKGIEYQEHVSEYGVHWNFFFTLAAVELLTTSIRIPARYQRSPHPRAHVVARSEQPSPHCSGQRACEPTQPCLQEPPADLRLILTPLD